MYGCYRFPTSRWAQTYRRYCSRRNRYITKIYSRSSWTKAVRLKPFLHCDLWNYNTAYWTLPPSFLRCAFRKSIESYLCALQSLSFSLHSQNASYEGTYVTSDTWRKWDAGRYYSWNYLSAFRCTRNESISERERTSNHFLEQFEGWKKPEGRVRFFSLLYGAATVSDLVALGIFNVQ